MLQTQNKSDYEIGEECLEVLSDEESRNLFISCGYVPAEIRITDVPIEETSKAG